MTKNQKFEEKEEGKLKKRKIMMKKPSLTARFFMFYHFLNNEKFPLRSLVFPFLSVSKIENQ